jgi:hypothetical protein
MSAHVCLVKRGQLARKKISDSLINSATFSGIHLYVGCLQSGQGFWADMARNHNLHAVARERLCGLRARTLNRICTCRVVNGQLLAVLGIDYPKEPRPAKPWVQKRVWFLSLCCDGNFHME